MNAMQAKGKDAAFANDPENEMMKDADQATDDVREALYSMLRWGVEDDEMGLVDRILARFEVRPRGTVTKTGALARMSEWRGWFATGEAPSPSEWAEFDRRFAALEVRPSVTVADAEALAGAWDEGFSLATRNSPNRPHPMAEMNPYRSGEQDESATGEEGAWEYGVRHFAVDGWPTDLAHGSLEGARTDLATCGWNCYVIRRRAAQEAGKWEPLEAAREVRS